MERFNAVAIEKIKISQLTIDLKKLISLCVLLTTLVLVEHDDQNYLKVIVMLIGLETFFSLPANFS